MIRTRNTNTAPWSVYDYMTVYGVTEETRNGPCLSVPHPVTIEYSAPQEMVNFCPVRDANPFFHFMEMLWMVEGKGDTDFICKYLPRMMDYSDDGKKFNAHYGYNIRFLFSDQIDEVVRHLQDHPNSRRAVVQIWNPADLNKDSKDLACNLILLFRIIDDQLCMTIYNRSNDAVWGGVTGANITNLGIYQIWVAARLHRPVGKQWVVSNNLHLYTENPKVEPLLKKYTGSYPGIPVVNPYEEIDVGTIIDNPNVFVVDCRRFCHSIREGRVLEPNRYYNPLLSNTAIPMALAHEAFKAKQFAQAKQHANMIQAEDWRIACLYWLERRAVAP